MAPEILDEQGHSFPVDWWALGILLYEMMVGRNPFDMGATDNIDQDTEDLLFDLIKNKPIRPPRSLSVRAGRILRGFLQKDPKERLGSHPESGFQDIMDHPFYSTIDWVALEQKQVSPPYIPCTTNDERDLTNFPQEFTDESVQFTPDNPTFDINLIDQSEFDGFEYVNPLLMSAEDVV